MIGTEQDSMLDLQRDMLRWLIAKKRSECEHFFPFMKFMWKTVCPERYVHNWHIQVICDECETVGWRLIKRLPKEYDLIFNMPPGETKTTPVSQLFPAWLWTQDKTLRIISSSHGHRLSVKNSMKSKDCIESDRFNLVFDRIDFKYNMEGKGHYMTTQGGERLSTSVKSNVTGEHCHLKIIDDLIDASKIVSRAMIEAANEHLDALSSRNVDERITTNILLMQRLAHNDPTTYALKKWKTVRHIILPAEKKFPVNPPELRKKYKDGILNPKRKPKEVLADKKEEMGISKYNAQYGQKPEDTTGKLVKSQWIECIPEWKFYAQIGEERTKDFLRTKAYATGDLAYTENEDNDPSGILPFKYWENILYCLDFFEWYLEAPDAIVRISETCVDLDITSIAIENKGPGLSMQPLLTRNGINAIVYPQSRADKKARLIDKIDFIKSNRVKFIITPQNEKRVAKAIEYLEAFQDETVPDEIVDCLVMAINEVDTLRRPI